MERTPEQDAAINDIRSRLVGGCGAEEFAAMRCPLCGRGLKLDIHSRGRTLFVRCASDSTHVAFHAATRDAPEWWAAHKSGGWLADAEPGAAADGPSEPGPLLS